MCMIIEKNLFIVVRMYSTVRVSLSEISPNLLPSWDRIIHTFTYFISSDKRFCEVFSAVELGPCFFTVLVAWNISWPVKTHWNFRTARYWDRQSDLLRLKAWVSCDKTKSFSQTFEHFVAQQLSRWSLAETSLDRRWTVTESTSTEEPHGTNLKPILPIHFF
jgi:hypothetical protein